MMVYKGLDAPLCLHVNGDVITGNNLAFNIDEMSSGDVMIGQKYVDEDGWYCSTMVDELMLWSRSLTQEEVENVMLKINTGCGDFSALWRYKTKFTSF